MIGGSSHIYKILYESSRNLYTVCYCNWRAFLLADQPQFHKSLSGCPTINPPISVPAAPERGRRPFAGPSQQWCRRQCGGGSCIARGGLLATEGGVAQHPGPRPEILAAQGTQLGSRKIGKDQNSLLASKKKNLEKKKSSEHLICMCDISRCVYKYPSGLYPFNNLRAIELVTKWL